MSLATKYRPKTWEDVTEQGLVIQMLKSMCESELSNRCFLLTGPAGTGKAQPLDSHVLTPNGFIEMRDVKVGMEVFTSKGNIAKVSGVYPQGVRPIYEITLSDRTKIRVSDEHLNVVYRYNQDYKIREDFCLTTLELIDLFKSSRFKLRIDLPSVDWNESDLPIDPYLLGALIGDGSMSSGNLSFCNTETDVIDKVDSILQRDWGKHLVKHPTDPVSYYIRDIDHSYHKYTFYYKGNTYNSMYSITDALNNDGYNIRADSDTLLRICNGTATKILGQYPELIGAVKVDIDDNYNVWTDGDPLRNVLKSLGLMCKSSEKHIPEIYLYSSFENRIKLLQGLFDTDGCISTGGALQFNTCSDRLSDDFVFLVRSLGIRDTVCDSPARYKKDGDWIFTGTTSHDHNLKVENGFEFCTSIKHRSRITQRQQPPLRNIVSIEYVGDDECQCIMIDHDDHTYISDGFIPTHNTTTGRLIATYLNGSTDNLIEIDAASNNGVDAMRNLVQQAETYPIGTKYKIILLDEVHVLSPQAFQVLLKTFEEQPAKTVFIACTTNPEKIPPTILSRVQSFQLSKISLEGIKNRLKFVMDSEIAEGQKYTYTDDAILYISKLSNGGMRDSLTLLEKSIAYSPDVTTENVVKALNLPNYDDYFALLGAYAKKDNAKIAEIIDRVYNSGVNFQKWFEGFHGFVMNVVKYIFLQDIQKTVIPSYYEDKISKYGTPHVVICLKLANRLVDLNTALKTTQYLQETALTYLCSIQKAGG